MTVSAGMQLAIELALFALAVVVLLIGIVGRGGGGPDPRAAKSSESVGQVPRSGSAESSRNGSAAGWVTLFGLLAIFGLTFTAAEGASILRGSFVQDALALFAKRLFLASAAISVLGSLTLHQYAFSRR